jgi:conjugative transfer signal peptidase TraF
MTAADPVSQHGAGFERQLRRGDRMVAYLTIAGFIVLIVVGNWAFGDICWNETASMPPGFWRVTPLTGPLRRGMIVSICPPDDAMTRQAVRRGYLERAPACPSGTIPLLKHVLALPGDVVRVKPGGLAVDGKAVPLTAPQTRDDKGRPMQPVPAGRYRVKPGFVWVYAPNPRSWDSRYLGAIPIANIRGQAEPVWTWK